MDGNKPADPSGASIQRPGASPSGLRFADPGATSSQQSAPQAAVWKEEGTNVVRVPFGVRRARRRRPARPDHWATLVIPFQIGGGPHPTPPQAA